MKTRQQSRFPHHQQHQQKAVLAIETDGYSFHNDATEQHRRDKMKGHILALYSLPLIRLSTKGSGERERIIEQLNNYI